MAEQGHVLLSVEAEAYVQSLEYIDIKEIGSPRWNKQHEYIEKLNMQAVMNAAVQENEFIKEYLINEEKIRVLVMDLIATEIWKDRIFSQFISSNFEPKVTFPIYMVIYHEATVINLLETVLYHEDSCEAAGDCLLDLLDYCVGKLVPLVTRDLEEVDDDETEEEDSKSNGKSSNLKELATQKNTLELDISVKCLSVIRYLTDNLSVLPLSALGRMLNTHDLPSLLVQLMRASPWTREKSGKLEKYTEGKWKSVEPTERFKITKTEGQMWLALYHLLMEQQCQQKYEINDFRKNTLLRLRAFLNEVIIDQLPILADMQMYLERLSMMEPPPIEKNLILEQVPEIRDSILASNEGAWKRIAAVQAKNFFNTDGATMRDQARRWADTYSFDQYEGLLTDPPKCGACGEAAAKRCGRCQNEWYCRRQCQVEHWAKHKVACDLVNSSKVQEASAGGDNKLLT